MNPLSPSLDTLPYLHVLNSAQTPNIAVTKRFLLANPSTGNDQQVPGSAALGARRPCWTTPLSPIAGTVAEEEAEDLHVGSRQFCTRPLRRDGACPAG